MVSRRLLALVMLTLVAAACGGSRHEGATPAGDDLRIAPLADGGTSSDQSSRSSGKVDDETHSATREDCTAIVDANVEVQLRVAGLTDAAVLEQRKKEMREHLADDIQQCIGKNVSAKMIRCVKSAKTLPDIDRCLR